MDWFDKNLSEVRRPYEIRGIYNQHKGLILSDDHLFKTTIDFINNFQPRCTDKLDKESIDNLLSDIETDKEEFDRNPPKIKISFTDSVNYDPAMPCFKHGSHLSRAKEFSRPSKIIKINILDEHAINLLEEVQNELLRIAVLRCSSNYELCEFLGVSDRTAKNYIQEYIKTRGHNYELTS